MVGGGVAKNRSVCFRPGCVFCVIPADPQSAWPVYDLSLGFNFPSRFTQVTHIIIFCWLSLARWHCVNAWPCCCVVLLCVCVWAGHGFTDVCFWGYFAKCSSRVELILGLQGWVSVIDLHIDIPLIFYVEKYSNYVADKWFACLYFDSSYFSVNCLITTTSPWATVDAIYTSQQKRETINFFLKVMKAEAELNGCDGSLTPRSDFRSALQREE